VDGRLADAEGYGRLVQRDLSTFAALAIAVEGNVVLMPERADASARPAVPVTGRFARSIEHSRDRLVRHLARQGANQVDHFCSSGPSCLAGAVPRHCYLGVIAALPVNDQLQSVAHNVDDDLKDYRALLARLRRDAGTLPSSN